MPRLAIILLALVTVFASLAAASTSCSPGYGFNGNNCQQCQSNQYSTGGTAQCTNCPANHYSNSGAGSCTPCAAGYQSTGGQQCQPCSAGTFSVSGGSCQSCPSGQVSGQAASSCSACAPGSYPSSTHAYCQLTQAGTYTDQPGLAAPIACTPGYYQTYTGQTGCNPCPCGTYSSYNGSTTCQTCSSVNNYPGGTAQLASTSQSQCIAEAPGTYTDSSVCTQKCPSGTFSSGQGSSTCTSCGTNQISSPGATSTSGCTTCKVGTAPNAARSSCTPTSTAAAKKRSIEAPRGYCPLGFTACPVAGRRRIWECIDTATSIDSCGGCPGAGGVDCTDFDDLATASCVSGTCRYQCPFGMTMTEDGCVAASGQRRYRRPAPQTSF